MRHPMLHMLILLLSRLTLADDSGAPLPFVAEAEVTADASSVMGPNGEPAIKVTGGLAPSTTLIVSCSAPAIETHQYVVRGQIKYDGVSGDGYLELWSDFGDKGSFFSRSLADWGAMKKINGSSNWREFELPFHAEPGTRPQALTLNVVLPGAGTIVVARPTLFPIDTSRQWWSASLAGRYGGVLGSCLGILGAAIGILSTMHTTRLLIFALFAVGLAGSGIFLVAGLVGVCMQQPWHVYYPLLLIGIIGVSVLGGNLWNVLHRYRGDELRRIAAVDA